MKTAYNIGKNLGKMKIKNHKEILLSIVVPCYNEAGNIPLIIERFQSIIPKDKNIEVLLVNNGSTDNSEYVFNEQLANAQDNVFRVVHVPMNQGYGYGILSGLNEAKGDVLSWTHADMQTDPKDVLLAFERYEQECKDNPQYDVFIKGKRKNRSVLDTCFTFGMQLIASFSLKTWLDDVNAQPKLFSRNFYEHYIKTNPPYDFSLDLYALYLAKRHSKIYEIPVYFKERLHGEAKGGGGAGRQSSNSSKEHLSIFLN